MALEDRDNQLSDSVRRRRTVATDDQILCDKGELSDRSMMSVRLQLIGLYRFWVFRSSSLFSRFVCFGMFWNVLVQFMDPFANGLWFGLCLLDFSNYKYVSFLSLYV